MKIHKILLYVIICLSVATKVNAQFQQILSTGIYETDTSVNLIGIGTFGSPTAVHSALHINGDALQTATGEVFRTNAPADSITYWRMLRGNNQIGYIWNDTANNHFNIQSHQTSGRINFYNSPVTPGTGILRMTILPSGYVGINTANPTDPLDVAGIINTSHEYRIRGCVALSLGYPGSTNVFVGCAAGVNSNSSAANNTFVGSQAGVYNFAYSHNTYIGKSAGYDNRGNANTFIGSLAGPGMAPGGSHCDSSVFVGYHSGYLDTSGINNTFLGIESGSQNRVGDRNTFVGKNSGLTNITGSDNAYFGSYSQATGINASTLTNASAIGTRATVTQDNSLVLGSINGENGATTGINVGIGVSAPIAKFHVVNTTEVEGALIITDFNALDAGVGVHAITRGSNSTNIGLRGNAANTAFLYFAPPNCNIGVFGQGHSVNHINYGGRFEARGGVKALGGQDIGVYAAAGSGRAGFFQGSVFSTVGYFPSDINLKDSIAPITSALNSLAQLQPKTFVFKTDSFPYMNLPAGQQMGFVSQAIDTILPELVEDIFQPEIIDSQGTVLMDTFTIKALNYTGLIPLLVSGVNELNTGKVSSATTIADSSYVTKWSTTSKTLTNSAIFNVNTRVGINTTSPSSILTVNSATSGDIFRTNVPSGQTSTWRMMKNGTEYGRIYNNSGDTHLYVMATAGSGDLRFNAGSSTTPKMTVTSGARVGIRTTSPGSVLHVDGTGVGSTGEVFRTNGVSGAATYWRMFRNGTEYGTIYNNNDNHFYVQANNASGDLRFNSGGSNTRMTITSAGKVGIATTTPTAKFEVNGAGQTIAVSATGDSLGGYFAGDYVGLLGLATGSDLHMAGVVGMAQNATLRNYGG